MSMELFIYPLRTESTAITKIFCGLIVAFSLLLNSVMIIRAPSIPKIAPEAPAETVIVFAGLLFMLYNEEMKLAPRPLNR